MTNGTKAKDRKRKFYIFSFLKKLNARRKIIITKKKFGVCTISEFNAIKIVIK